ncbi:MAG: glycosyltransferase family 4 protein [Planctomycetaceae bacterium]|nr:glycosyltransferase family 4 protein [Planctomycetaceae bacterium]
MHTARLVYASFDRFPSAKGAATHINAFLRGLGRHFGQVDLVTIESEATAIGGLPTAHGVAQSIPATTDLAALPWSAVGVTQHGLPAVGRNLFERVLSFRAQLGRWWEQHLGAEPADIFHFRSIYEAYPLAREKSRFCRRMIYEVNGLPSIELKYHYPAVAQDRELLAKLHHQEQVCLEAADQIITVSDINAAHIVGRGIDERRIRVIRNGVDPSIFRCGPPTHISPTRPLQVLYSGTLSAWQGVQYAIEAVALLRRDFDAQLTLVGPGRPRQKKAIEELIWKQDLCDHVSLRPAVPQSELNLLQQQADVIVAPLTRNDRNLVQGCCPLKVIEAMASGTPVIASDLPVVRELASEGEVLFAKPGSAKSIKDAMLQLLQQPQRARALGQAAARKAHTQFGWQRAVDQLLEVYERLLQEPASV